jgi:hypothetical protein
MTLAKVKGTTDFDYVIPVSVTKRRVETEPTTDKEVQNIHSHTIIIIIIILSHTACETTYEMETRG